MSGLAERLRMASLRLGGGPYGEPADEQARLDSLLFLEAADHIDPPESEKSTDQENEARRYRRLDRKYRELALRMSRDDLRMTLQHLGDTQCFPDETNHVWRETLVSYLHHGKVTPEQIHLAFDGKYK